MARQSEFYKGQRKKRNYAIVPLVILLFLITLVVVLFYSTQKYAVITENGVKVELPLLGGEIISSEGTGDPGDSDYVPETVDVAIEFEEPDYSSVQASAGEKVRSARGIYIPYDKINYDSVEEYANRLSTGNSLMFDVKGNNGYLQWYTDSSVAYSYGLNMNSQESTANLKKMIDLCKERNIYLIAKMSVCRDDVFATHATNVILRDQYGAGFYDENGYYLDPYNELVREYTEELICELWDMGFDEVALDQVLHPIIENQTDENSVQVMYTREMSTKPSAVGAVCGFAVNLAQRLEDKREEDGKFLSIYINGPTSLVRADESTGQDGRFFLKLFDRVYYDTDMYAYTFNVEDIRPGVTIGDYHDRFVPVVINYLPDNTSWILVDKEE